VNKCHLYSCPANGEPSVPNNLESKSGGLESRFKRDRRFKNGGVLRHRKSLMKLQYFRAAPVVGIINHFLSKTLIVWEKVKVLFVFEN
jgi:hypothetical protein